MCLDNLGGWCKLLASVIALSKPQSLIFITYTDRGQDKLFQRFLTQRVQRYF